MSYNRNVTVLYGVRVPQLSHDEWETKLNDFINRGGIDSGVVGYCAEYNGIERAEVDGEILYEYLIDWHFLITCEFLDSDFLGEDIITLGDDEGTSWRDLREISEQTFDVGVIGQLICALFPDKPIIPYLIDWVI